MVGSAILRELKKKYPKVIFHGAKSKEELEYYYNKADVFVFPSKTDTFGLVLLEAMGGGFSWGSTLIRW